MPKIHSAPIRVHLISSRDLIRSGLRALLRGQPQIRLAAESSAPSDAALADVVLWDVGAEKPRALPTRFIALIANSQNAPVWLDAGASGIVFENSSIELLLDSIRQVARGETFLPRELARQVAASLAIAESSREPPVESLTEREREVLRLLAQGSSNKEIAQKLYLSVRTVEGHLANIYGKLQVKSRMEAALWAIQNL